MDLIAHRGFASEAPENTLAALCRAAAVGADAVEFDVRRCGSGEPVVIHDPTVDRVTGATGRVAEFDRETLAGMDVLGSGEGVPALADVVAAVPPEVTLNAELKDPVVGAAVPTLADADHDVLVSSFDPAILGAVADRAPGMATAYLCVAGDNTPLARASAEGCRAVHPDVELALSAEFVDRAHDRGMAVNAWTVEDRDTARTLEEAGVDGVIADRSDVV